MSTDAEQIKEWHPAGSRRLRSRTNTNHIITLTGDALEMSAFKDGTEASLFARKNEIILYRWENGIPPAITGDRDENEDIYLPAGVREVHSSGTSIIITITNRALRLAGFQETDNIQLWARENTIKLTPDGPDVEV